MDQDINPSWVDVGPIAGPTGFTGSASTVRGYSGSVGYTGSRGAGYTGSASTVQGPTGYTGSAGADGAAVDKGYTGSQGVGYVGSQGATGPQGVSVNLLGTKDIVAHLPSFGQQLNDAWIVNETGDMYLWNTIDNVWSNIGKIVGYTGSTGSQGNVGYSGSAGAGYTGSASTAAGYAGSQGDVGYTGSAGAGYTGSASTAEGYTGSVGYTGSAGAGYTGSKGYVGSAGIAIVSGSAPPAVPAGTLWYNSNIGTLKVYYVGASSSFWVDVVGGPSGRAGYVGSAGTNDVPQNAQTSAYTLVATDAGKHISITTGGVTVPANTFTIGNAITIYNNSSVSQSIIQGSGVIVYLVGTSYTGNRLLAGRGLVSLLCVASNAFVLTGGGLS